MTIYLIQNEKQTGPFTLEEVRGLPVRGEVSAVVPAWHPDLQGWLTLGDLPELRDIFTQAQEQSIPPPPQGSPRPQRIKQAVSGLAIASLVLGVAGLFSGCITGIPAIICGRNARQAIAESPDRLSGESVALAGLICGYVFTAVSAIGLVVFGISMIFVMGATPSPIARQRQAQVDVRAIAYAIKMYYTEYGMLPLPNDTNPASEATVGDEGTGNESVIGILCATNSPESLNPKHLVFLKPSASMDSVGQERGIREDGNFYDPWGNPYRIRLDSAYTGSLHTPQGEITSTNVIVWSIGPEGKAIIGSWE